ncbi:HNH endonuclease [Microcoleus vaginatus]|uniref:HNH endonuclease n=1 Tax=Microcoleus vaginatus TaxID=119532 RepID=UPI002416C5A9
MLESHHRVPVGQGGLDDVENLEHLHKTCPKQVGTFKNQVETGLKQSLSAVSWKLSCCVLRGGERGDSRTLPAYLPSTQPSPRPKRISGVKKQIQALNRSQRSDTGAVKDRRKPWCV